LVPVFDDSEHQLASPFIVWVRPNIRRYFAGFGGAANNTTYINIGIWKDLASFDAAVGKYIQAPERRKPLGGSFKDEEMLALYQHDFEFKIRERVILKKLLDRKGALELPPADLS